MSRWKMAALAIAVGLGVATGSPSGAAPSDAVGEEAPAGEARTPEGPAAVAAPVVDESPEQARRRELTARHGGEVAEAILRGTVLLGMTKEQVTLARGAPTRKEAIPPDAELWRYAGGEVAFSGGTVTYVGLTPARPPPAGPKVERAPQRPEPRPAVGGAPSGPVTAPPIRVGDSYVYEAREPDYPESSVVTRRTVTSTKGPVVLSSVNVNSKKAKPRLLHFNGEWNLVAVRNADDSGLDYAPPLKYYEFPLYPGKTWRQTTTETNSRTGATRTHTVSGTVGPWEDVVVPAGSFRALRVSLQTELFDPSTGERQPGTDVSWYVPEVRRSVRSLTTGKDGKQRSLELIEYQLSPAGTGPTR
jgi:hypothetical protein